MPRSLVICLRCSCRYELVRGQMSAVQQTVCPRCSYPGWTPSARARTARPA